ncbi:hypothetical protein [Nocardia mexicana]|uniref:Uncharacterized protein n=1 Tax=Nocardia mexicana TaxID=279262 RepID=A0A370GKB3_9NOCA|nr:hypothetical protein [Nocardia mexicana]RDI43719.1 hypothetical protein DFR68_119106 [Nocardia mexicana]
MTSPANTLLDRYQDYRVRRWLVYDERTSGMLPGWRSRARRRALVVAVAAAIAVLFVVGVLCAFDLRWAPLIWLPAAAVFLPAWTVLRIVSQRQDSAPTPTLDEFEIAQRNTARSIGLTLTQSLTLVPLLYLIAAGAVFPEADAFRTAYAGGAMALAALLAGGCAPGMILGWTQPDPEPEP